MKNFDLRRAVGGGAVLRTLPTVTTFIPTLDAGVKFLRT